MLWKKYIDLAEFKFEFEDRKSIETRCKVGSRLYVNDEFITDMLKRGSASDASVESLRITLGVDNAAIEIEDYTLAPKIEINSFYNIPPHIAIIQSRNTDVDILGQNIGKLQADCSRVMLADCQVKQADIGLRNLYTQKFKSNESENKVTVCRMTSLDIRACNIDIYNKRRGRICLPRRNFPSEIAAFLSVKTGDRLSKPYRQW